MSITTSHFGKFKFYDCGAFGMFSPVDERWQPNNHGKPTSQINTFFNTPRPAIDPAKNLIWAEISQIVRPLGSGTTILDVGAYIGTFCLPAALCAAQEGIDVAIHSFEPGPTGEVLAINIDLNALADRIIVHTEAVTDFDGYTLYTFKQGGAIGGNLFEKPSETSLERVVPARTLDTVVKDLGDPLFIKLDTQGHEPRIFKGARGIVAAKRACWRIEYLKWSARAAFDDADFATFLMKEFHCIEDGKILPDTAAMDALIEEIDTRKSRMTDLVLVPKDAPFTERVLAGFA
ncbi:FkbM family methyltransferase [Acuticoccus yangtzensis]|uniref:FkbM family methyltransferase n=1 Tax=Acuticoccus yangtzensis TaxID=1443441 RepID=UPI0009499B9E|nr:FkbM family methyltransferase [Acuticoccus yangtzensis]